MAPGRPGLGNAGVVMLTESEPLRGVTPGVWDSLFRREGDCLVTVVTMGTRGHVGPRCCRCYQWRPCPGLMMGYL